MGSSESKLRSNDGKDLPSNNSSPSTPMKCTDTNSENFSHLDPRSPSEDIYRTPIEIPKENTDIAIPPLKHLIDPRSPTDQFDRTPIVIKESQSHIPKKLHNKILDNARRNITYSPTQTPKNKSSTDSQKTMLSPPKLISSIPTFKKCNEKRKSYVGLLETNIDFTETNLDDIVKNKSLDKSLTININESSLCEIVERKNCDPRSPSKEFLRTPIQIVQKVGEVEINTAVSKCEDQKSLDIEEYHTSDSLLKLADNKDLIESENNEVEVEQENEQIEILPERSETKTDENAEGARGETCELDVSVEKKIEADDANTDSQSTEGSNKVDGTEQIMAEIVDDLVGNISTLALDENRFCIGDHEIREPIIDLTADVQEFDKKLTKIIHENNENFSFKNIISKDYLTEKPKKRTPMKDINQISEPKKNKLKVSDKPRKLNYDISKIPVFRDRNGIKTKVQCENTPPTDTKLRKKRTSHPKWDSDKTLVI